ncbi:MAG: hypothetical protein JWO25_295 [Alphaproteobacteria bacterium]|nr:hypothetical protein [Alphaproteobacteria bacterium]MDB5720109.1 hypothetical protein [Alphaproteobacteria bacterium]
MSQGPESLSHHPAPDAHKLSSARAFFILFGGPLAWFVQFNLGVILSGWPCYPSDRRLAAPPPDYEWTRAGAMAVLVLALLVAIAAGASAQIMLRRVRDEAEGGHAELAEIGHGRTRFIALWGIALGYGSAVAAALTLVAFLLVPRCAG